jgi:hypothetical protein
MKYIYYIVSIAITFTIPIIGMEPDPLKEQLKAIELVLTNSNEKPKTPFGIIPITLAQRCKTIKDMLEDINPDKSHTCTLTDKRFDSIAHFTAYLKKIDALNAPCSTSKQCELSMVLNEALPAYIKTLTTYDICALFNNVDYFDVIDKNHNNHLVNEIIDRFIKNPADIAFFACLHQKPLFRNVMQKSSLKIDFEKKFTQPLADSLTERHQLPRTVSMLSCLYHNTRNAITAPFRFFGYPWAKKTIFKPCYFNTTTGTLITSFTQQLGTNNTITRLLITQRDTDKRIDVPVENYNLGSITNIVANKAESVFICSAKNKTIIINALD